jgi:hypothetical protein
MYIIFRNISFGGNWRRQHGSLHFSLTDINGCEGEPLADPGICFVGEIL